MKLVPIVLVLMLVALPIFAEVVPPKSELVVSGSYFKAKDAEAVWNLDAALGAAIGDKGAVLFGPKFRFSSDDSRTALGAVLHWNFLGSSKSGPYIGANGLYNLKEVEGERRYSADAEVGLKLQVAADCKKACGGINLSASQTMWGRGKDGARPVGFVGTFIRF